MNGPAKVVHPIVSAPLDSRFFSVPDGARLVEPGGESQAVTFPGGFLAGGLSAGLKSSGRPDVGVLAVEPKWWDVAASAAVFTTNAFAAAPVQLVKTECSVDRLVAVAMNSANANACTGNPGMIVARRMQHACAESLSAPIPRVAVASTGVIGVQLDADFMSGAVVDACGVITPRGGPLFSQAILTTDRYAKMCAIEVESSSGPVRLGLCAKGAGMIAPAMATMLCAVTTDAVCTPGEMRALLSTAVDGSFNRATVDGEMSTNDAVFFFSSGASGIRLDEVGHSRMQAALNALLLRGALMMVADGEGATKIMRIVVEGAESKDQADLVARAVADSPLVKTAMHGGDPNWGRIVSSAGAAMAGRELPEASLKLCDVTVFEHGMAASVSESDGRRLASGVRGTEVEIRLDLGLGGAQSELFFADLGHEYVTINAEYHT